MQTNEVLTTTGQTNTAPATQQTAADTGTAPAAEGQQQQTQSVQAPAQQTQAASETEQGKTDTDGQSASKAPEQYAEFTAPEGYKLEGDFGNEFKSLAKELGLTQDQAQKLVDLDVKRANAQIDVVQKASAEWQSAAHADKEFGGANLEENVAIAKKALDTFGTPELKELLQTSGLGNHPEIIRAFFRAGKAISEDRFVTRESSDSKAQVSTAQRLYPNMNP